MNSKKIIFFDTDQTLWESKDNDYISSVRSNIIKIDQNTLIRGKDQKLFKLKKGVVGAFKYLYSHREKVIIGIISDNKTKPVISALKLFGLWSYISKQAVLIKLWKGYCPKDEMINKVLSQNKQFKNIDKQDIFLIDDKDYSKVLNNIGMNFIKVERETDILTLVKTLVKL